MDQSQTMAVIAELEAQRNLLGTRCTQLAIEKAAIQLESQELQAKLTNIEKRIESGELVEVSTKEK